MQGGFKDKIDVVGKRNDIEKGKCEGMKKGGSDLDKVIEIENMG